MQEVVTNTIGFLKYVREKQINMPSFTFNEQGELNASDQEAEVLKLHPNLKKENTMDTQGFKWSDTSALEFANFIMNKGIGFFNNKQLLEQFKTSKITPHKDYEILSFVYPETGFLLHKNEDGTFGIYSIDEYILSNIPIHKIHSVKRLSDGEVFTIGDRVNNRAVLERLFLAHGEMFAGASTQDAVISLFELKKEPKHNWVVFTVEQFNMKSWVPYDLNREKYLFNKSKEYYYRLFKTEQEAKDFIIDNKPCLSKKECEDICTEWLGKRQDSFGTNLLYYIKEKLGL
jgi:hypothetical protein